MSLEGSLLEHGNFQLQMLNCYLPLETLRGKPFRRIVFIAVSWVELQSSLPWISIISLPFSSSSCKITVAQSLQPGLEYVVDGVQHFCICKKENKIKTSVQSIGKAAGSQGISWGKTGNYKWGTISIEMAGDGDYKRGGCCQLKNKRSEGDNVKIVTSAIIWHRLNRKWKERKITKHSLFLLVLNSPMCYMFKQIKMKPWSLFIPDIKHSEMWWTWHKYLF